MNDTKDSAPTWYWPYKDIRNCNIFIQNAQNTDLCTIDRDLADRLTYLGMICDGAKESCGLKVSNAASEAWSAAMLALENRGIRNTQGIISPDIHELGITLREFNEKIFSAADSVMIGLMTRQNRSAESRA